MDEEKTIVYKMDGGPIVVHILPGYATLGSYSIAYVIDGKTISLGSGSVGDAIPDVYILPVLRTDLQKCTLFIAATFVPAPGHSQVAVKYQFLQNSQETKGNNPILINATQPALSSTHTVDFKPE